MKLSIGEPLPSFSLPTQDGTIFSSDSLAGNRAMSIYFYPKDETAGCTAEACSFRDSYQDFKDAGAEVIGISSDEIGSHAAFAQHHRLPFLLLSDSGSRLRQRFGVPGSLFGMLPGRVTYVVDRQGIVRYIFNSQLNTGKHISEALRILKEINQ